MSSLTKQQLQNELINHGVQLPPAGSKKDEYVRAYNEHVVKDKDKEKGSGDFSSDDEVEPYSAAKTLDKAGIVVGKVCIEEAEEIVNSLLDVDLYEMLKSLGQNIGPVVATTRPIYKLMLRNLLTGQKRVSETKEVSPTNGSGNGVPETELGNGHGEEYSDSDREIETPTDSPISPTPRTTRASGNSEFEEYFLSYVDARQAGQRNSEVNTEKRKNRSSSRQTSTPRRESSPATTAAATAAGRGTPPKFALPKPAEKDTPMPIIFRKVPTGIDSTSPATYRRTPTPNPELTRRNLAPRSLDLEPEPTALKRKTINKPEAGKSTNGNNQNEVDNSRNTGPNVGVLFLIFATLTLAILGYIWYSFSAPIITQEEIEDLELDKIIESLG